MRGLSPADQPALGHVDGAQQAAVVHLAASDYLPGQGKTNLSALALMRHLGMSYPAAWRVKYKLMHAMTEREAGCQPGGVVQLDDACLGGERNGGKAGRGSENKRPFVIAVETTDEGRPRYAVIDPVPTFSKAALAPWSARRLQPGSDVYSDRLGAFRVLERSMLIR